MTGCEPLFGTFSLVARAPAGDGTFGAAIASGAPAVGSFCLFAEHGLGLVATQAWTNPYLGPAILERLREGDGAAAALASALADDPGARRRQVGLVAMRGPGQAFSGSETVAWSGQLCGDGVATQGNMLAGPAVLDAMLEAFSGAGGPFVERLLAALSAGAAAGGDRRGLESAAVLVTGPEIYAATDLRVDAHETPVAELERVYAVARRRLLPSLAAMPTRSDPLGDIARIEALLAPEDEA